MAFRGRENESLEVGSRTFDVYSSDTLFEVSEFSLWKGGGVRRSVVRTTFVNSRQFTLYALFTPPPPSFRISDSRVFTLSLGFTYPPFHRTNLARPFLTGARDFYAWGGSIHSRIETFQCYFFLPGFVYPLSSLLFDSFLFFFFSYCTCSRKQFGLLSCSW